MTDLALMAGKFDISPPRALRSRRRARRGVGPSRLWTASPWREVALKGIIEAPGKSVCIGRRRWMCGKTGDGAGIHMCRSCTRLRGPYPPGWGRSARRNSPRADLPCRAPISARAPRHRRARGKPRTIRSTLASVPIAVIGARRPMPAGPEIEQIMISATPGQERKKPSEPTSISSAASHREGCARGQHRSFISALLSRRSVIYKGAVLEAEAAEPNLLIRILTDDRFISKFPSIYHQRYSNQHLPHLVITGLQLCREAEAHNVAKSTR